MSTFFEALGDLWARYFADAGAFTALGRAVGINLSQAYLELLEEVLGTSLERVPAFSRKHVHLFQIREDQLRFVEGASPDLDGWVYTPPTPVGGVPYLLNRLALPTAVWTWQRDYVVADGVLRFVARPTDADVFPRRDVAVVAPMRFRDPTRVAWSGAKPGDVLWWRVAGGEPRRVELDGVTDATLYGAWAPEFATDVSRRTVRYGVVRKPHDYAIAPYAIAVRPFFTRAVSGDTLVGTTNLDLAADAAYRGAWTASTAYAQGDIVTDGGNDYVALDDHTSGLTFAAGTTWVDVVGCHVYVGGTASSDDGLARISAVVGGGVYTLDRVPVYLGATGAAVTFAVLDGPATCPLRHTLIEGGSVTVAARRAHDVVIDGVTYPAGGAVVEGVDYAVEVETGVLTLGSLWDARVPPFVAYRWWLTIDDRAFTPRGAWTDATAYAVGDTVVDGGRDYVCAVAHTSSGTLDPVAFVPYLHPFTADVTRLVPEAALWGVRVLLDRRTLYETFGYLLDLDRPTSEAYRAFLRGVAQLYVLGPTLGRFESALNVAAGFPVVRLDGEIWRGFDDGVALSGTGATLYGRRDGTDGVTDVVAATLTAASALFFPDDVGAVVHVGRVRSVHVVASVTSATTVVLDPPPPADATLQPWDVVHTRQRNVLTAAAPVFGTADLGAFVTLTDGTFRVVAVPTPSTVVLDAPFVMSDASGVAWSLSRTGRQVVTTDRNVYEFPLGVPIRDDVVAGTSALTFQAFEALTTAFVVADYVSDPNWWHRVRLPPEIVEADIVRDVIPEFIDHTFDPVDGARFGDAGIFATVDDEGVAPVHRTSGAVWYGGDALVLADAIARNSDVGTYLTFTDAPWPGQYRIKGLDPDGVTLHLDRFPPPGTGVPPLAVTEVELQPDLLRRSVAFVLMDRYLKAHALYVRIAPVVSTVNSFVHDFVRVLRVAKAGYTFVYVDAAAELPETIDVEDELAQAIGVTEDVAIAPTDNAIPLDAGSALRVADAFRYVDETGSISGTPGTYPLPATEPAGDVESSVVELRFDAAVLVAGGTRSPAEGEDYTVDYAGKTITILAGSSFPVGPNDVFYVTCVRRIRGPLDTLDPGETMLCVSGTDPTALGTGDVGIVDRAVQIEFA